ncbi:DMT family transporter [Rhodocyclus tenuis]|uniref:Drug/metabolite transporter (DMT)-like permease n=1 Tax=Rhodocyclus tenuis TaxID=1066 RepID=A0A840GII9_RHOTE|nr:DMT family transporter [Rhodocyclus tenuis]MBB4247999.1 drug/metabolite transporter (DMT)-like permease [Rhodocyclus tenuis]
MTARSARLNGYLFVVIAAGGFGAMPIFARFAYAEGVDLATMLFLRFAIAAALMTLVMLLWRLRWPRGRDLWLLIGMGALGYVGQAYCYFAALRYATAGLTTLLLYLYPAIVTILAAVLARRRLSGLRLAAVLAALFGAALAVGDSIGGSPLGIILGVGAALIYSVYILVGARVTDSAGAIPGATVVMLSAAAVYGGIALAQGMTLPHTGAGWAAVAGIAVLSTAAAIAAFLAAMKRLGAADAATLSTLEPVITIVLAAIFLGEAIGLRQLLGGAVILAAVLVLTRLPKTSA